MANVTETAEFTPGIYQLETTDDVVGGADGISNLQAKQLANRTQWLKGQVETNASAIEALAARGVNITGFAAGTTTIPATDLGKLLSYDTDGGAVTATLPAASSGNVGRIIVIQHNELGGLFTANGLTVQRAGSNTIFYNGVSATSMTLDAGDILILSMSSATAWTVIAWHRRSDLVPVGAVMPFAFNATPLGWLKCNGQSVSRTQYAELFARIGTTYGAGNGTTTFNLPDLRGEFVRGFDDGRGIDTGRTIGSAQGQDIQSHTHTHNTTNKTGLSSSAYGNNVTVAANLVGGSPTTGPTSDATGGTETRPRNVALLYCIKY